MSTSPKSVSYAHIAKALSLMSKCEISCLRVNDDHVKLGAPVDLIGRTVIDWLKDLPREQVLDVCRALSLDLQ